VSVGKINPGGEIREERKRKETSKRNVDFVLFALEKGGGSKVVGPPENVDRVGMLSGRTDPGGVGGTGSMRKKRARSAKGDNNLTQSKVSPEGSNIHQICKMCQGCLPSIERGVRTTTSE